MNTKLKLLFKDLCKNHSQAYQNIIAMAHNSASLAVMRFRTDPSGWVTGTGKIVQIRFKTRIAAGSKCARLYFAVSLRALLNVFNGLEIASYFSCR